MLLRKIVASSGYGVSTIVSTNNHALYVPITFPCDATLYALRAPMANTNGNYDIGFYGPDLARIASTGATAMAVGVQTLTLPEIRVYGGETYFAAVSFSLATAQMARPAFSAGGFHPAVGWGMEASAHPLPATATPVSTSAYTAIPPFAFGVR